MKKEEKIEAIFPGKVKKKEEIETSTISDKVYETIMNNKCVDIHDRKTPLDYWLCVLAFIFDINFKETLRIIKNNNYVDTIIEGTHIDSYAIDIAGKDYNISPVKAPFTGVIKKIHRKQNKIVILSFLFVSYI